MNTISKLKLTMRSLGVALLLGTATATAAVNSGNTTLNRLEIKSAGQNIVTGFNPSTTSYDVTVDALPVLSRIHI